MPKPKVKNPRGSHYEVHHEVALLFGLTELKAQLVWMENGVERRLVLWLFIQPSLLNTNSGRAELVYDEAEGFNEM